MSKVNYVWGNFVQAASALAVRLAAPAMGVALLGCTNLDGFSGSGPPPFECPLPKPDIPRGPTVVLSADEQQRDDKVCQYVWDGIQARGWIIDSVTQGYDGDIYLWILASSVPGSNAPPPPPIEDLQPASGFQLTSTELDMYPELRGRPGTIPRLRPPFGAYVDGDTPATSPADFVNNYQVTGATSGDSRLYAGLGTPISDSKLYIPNQGATTWGNAFSGTIERGTMSVLEMVIGCPNEASHEMEQQIGIAAMRDYANFDKAKYTDSKLRVQVEFLTVGPTWTGPTKGGWESLFGGDMHLYEGSLYPPGVAILNPSTVGGPQSEARFDIVLFEKNWWVAYNGNWFGYYEPKVWKDTFPPTSCVARWYGEVYDPAYNPSADPPKWTNTDMASGRFAAEGWGYAGHFRNLAYIDTNFQLQNPDINEIIKLRNDNCYTMSPLTAGQAPSLERFFHLGGPGGDAPLMNCPAPKPPQP